ncbi:MAG: hypothetical protein HOD63_13685 [Bacteroidetes bacterium]|jgi:hypothetical protein|nr:hypothetical protein [Bacteroidota bacterium]MBT5528769.1 hypothetical protein [Cytophagia bacterium]MBT3800138.1 hypothetical protein [Bacteroidota bacterium]MBT3935926.1 hypothetical protein [Bacteroidota bacterium]MBT4339640.1 hypothetical protein [Bacteroidota bacterium]
MKIVTKYFLFVLVLHMFSQANAFQADTSKIDFKGSVVRLKYTVNRQVSEAPFSIKNNTGKSITVELQGAFLVRGKHYDPLAKPKMSMYYRNKMRKLDEISIPPGRKVNFNLVFKPFTIYTGSTYTILCQLLVDGQRIDAASPISMFKLEQADKNKLKNTEQK